MDTQALKECMAQAPLLSGLLTETLPELEANNPISPVHYSSVEDILRQWSTLSHPTSAELTMEPVMTTSSASFFATFGLQRQGIASMRLL